MFLGSHFPFLMRSLINPWIMGVSLESFEVTNKGTLKKWCLTLFFLMPNEGALSDIFLYAQHQCAQQFT